MNYLGRGWQSCLLGLRDYHRRILRTRVLAGNGHFSGGIGTALDAGKIVINGNVESGFAVIDGVAPGVRVVVEGAQNLRPGSVVADTAANEKKPERRKP